ncbi:hypothetical protein KFK09_028124 [Dendrobium nobile]|uniref:Uncharacterized protein n=1 Tax=Dendrobium nobile TaxID=94219 RepID=A0A8T3A1W1_DENNO|nr:hypothetical protein KFK09_028124 [Dendrobium nobile]
MAETSSFALPLDWKCGKATGMVWIVKEVVQMNKGEVILCGKSDTAYCLEANQV